MHPRCRVKDGDGGVRGGKSSLGRLWNLTALKVAQLRLDRLRRLLAAPSPSLFLARFLKTFVCRLEDLRNYCSTAGISTSGLKRVGGKEATTGPRGAAASVHIKDEAVVLGKDSTDKVPSSPFERSRDETHPPRLAFTYLTQWVPQSDQAYTAADHVSVVNAREHNASLVYEVRVKLQVFQTRYCSSSRTIDRVCVQTDAFPSFSMAQQQSVIISNGLSLSHLAKLSMPPIVRQYDSGRSHPTLAREDCLSICT